MITRKLFTRRSTDADDVSNSYLYALNMYVYTVKKAKSLDSRCSVEVNLESITRNTTCSAISRLCHSKFQSMLQFRYEYFHVSNFKCSFIVVSADAVASKIWCRSIKLIIHILELLACDLHFMHCWDPMKWNYVHTYLAFYLFYWIYLV